MAHRAIPLQMQRRLRHRRQVLARLPHRRKQIAQAVYAIRHALDGQITRAEAACLNLLPT